MWLLKPKEFESVSALKSGDRVKYAIKRIADNRLVWLLRAKSEGWEIVRADDGRECIPVWPHEQFALACCKGNWASAKPTSVALEEFIEKWLPGMSAEGRHVAAFPVPGMRGIILEPTEFAKMLDAELARY